MTDSQPATQPDIHVAVANTRYAYIICIAPKNQVDKSTSYTMPQLRWDKADRASYYFIQLISFNSSYVEDISKAFATGCVSADCVRYDIESTYRTVVSFCALALELNMFLNVIRIFRRDASICIARISYGNASVWLAGWVSVTAGIVSKTTKPILKLFRASGSPIIEAFGTLCADTTFQEGPFIAGV